MQAAEPYHGACMAVLHAAIIYARHNSYSGELSSAESSDLMDAIHNIPYLAQNWETCNIELLRVAFLKAYQDKWAASGGPALCNIFDMAVQHADS